MGIRRYLKPSVILRRKALRSGVFGGDRKWLTVFGVMFVWRRIKDLLAFGDPQPVFVEEAAQGQRLVLAHQDSKKSLRKRRKTEKKAAKKATKKAKKAAAKATKKADKAAAKAARKEAGRKAARAARKASAKADRQAA